MENGNHPPQTEGGKPISKFSRIGSSIFRGGKGVIGVADALYSTAAGESVHVAVDRALDKIRRDPQRQNIGDINLTNQSSGEGQGADPLGSEPHIAVTSPDIAVSDTRLEPVDQITTDPAGIERSSVADSQEAVVDLSHASQEQMNGANTALASAEQDPLDRPLQADVSGTHIDAGLGSNIHEEPSAPAGDAVSADGNGGGIPPSDAEGLLSGAEDDSSTNGSGEEAGQNKTTTENRPTSKLEQDLGLFILNPRVLTWEVGGPDMLDPMTEAEIKKVDGYWGKFINNNGGPDKFTPFIDDPRYSGLKDHIMRRYKQGEKAEAEQKQKQPMQPQKEGEAGDSVNSEKFLVQPGPVVKKIEAADVEQANDKPEDTAGKKVEADTAATGDKKDVGSAAATDAAPEKSETAADEPEWHRQLRTAIDRLDDGPAKDNLRMQLSQIGKFDQEFKERVDALLASRKSNAALANLSQASLASSPPPYVAVPPPVQVDQQGAGKDKPAASPEPEAIRFERGGKPAIEQMRKKISESPSTELAFLWAPADLKSYAESLPFKSNGKLRNVVVTINPQGELVVKGDATGSKAMFKRNGIFSARIKYTKTGGVTVLDPFVDGDKEVVNEIRPKIKQLDTLLVEKMNEQLGGVGKINISDITEEGVLFTSKKSAK